MYVAAPESHPVSPVFESVTPWVTAVGDAAAQPSTVLAAVLGRDIEEMHRLRPPFWDMPKQKRILNRRVNWSAAGAKARAKLPLSGALQDAMVLRFWLREAAMGSGRFCHGS